FCAKTAEAVLISIAVVARFFFFQAEDGIRGFHVTGVQTCALPICWKPKDITPAINKVFSRIPSTTTPSTDGKRHQQESYDVLSKIGRASCRERAKTSGVAEPCKTKITMNRFQFIFQSYTRHTSVEP